MGDGIFLAAVEWFQPSVLHVSRSDVEQALAALRSSPGVPPPPCIAVSLKGGLVLVHGHARALAASLAGRTALPVVWAKAGQDWDLVLALLIRCRQAGVLKVADLARRALSPGEYDQLWFAVCLKMKADIRGSRPDGKKVIVMPD